MPPESDYEVGRGKPPKHSQWKPGQSGNPKGRPRKKHSLESALGGALHEKVTIAENGRRRKINKGEAICKSIVNAAATGDLKAAGLLVRMMEAIGRQKKLRTATAKPSSSEPVWPNVMIKLPDNGRDPELTKELEEAQMAAQVDYFARKGQLVGQEAANQNREREVA